MAGVMPTVHSSPVITLQISYIDRSGQVNKVVVLYELFVEYSVQVGILCLSIAMTGFLNLHALDIWGQKILCLRGGYAVGYRMLATSLASTHYILEAFSKMVTRNISGCCQISHGGKINLFPNHCIRVTVSENDCIRLTLTHRIKSVYKMMHTCKHILFSFSMT